MTMEKSISNWLQNQKVLAGILLLAGLIIYLPSIQYGFVFDDAAVIEKNEFVKQGIAGIPKILSSFYWQGYTNINDGIYRPVSLVMFAIEWQLIPQQPAIHHTMNIFFYLLSIVFLFQLLRHFMPTIPIWIPFSVALIFTIHPIHTEVVANIKSRDEIMCFFFFLLSIRYYVVKENKLLGLLFFALCLLSKESGFLFVPIIVFLGSSKSRFSLANLLKQHFVLALICVLWLVLHEYVIQSSVYPKKTYTYSDNSILSCADFSSRIATSITILSKYILNCLRPLNLSYDYSFNQIPCVTLISIQFAFAATVVLSMIALGIYYRKKVPKISFGIAFFFLTLLLSSNLLFTIGTTMADRLLFTPVLGCIIAIVCTIVRIKKQVITMSLLLVISILCFSLSLQRVGIWQSNQVLFSTDVKNVPNSAKANFNAATIKLEDTSNNSQEDKQFIIERLEKALEIDALHKGAMVNLSAALQQNGNFDKAIATSKKAISSFPNLKELNETIALSFFKKENYDSAIYYFQKCFDSDISKAENFNYCGVAWFNKKQYDSAIVVFEKGLVQSPNHIEMLLNLGSSFAINKKYAKAIETFEKVHALNPKQKKAIYFLEMAHKALGNKEKEDYYHLLYLSLEK